MLQDACACFIMYTSITIFYISLVGIILMIFLKSREVKTGRPSVMSRFGRGSDHIFSAVFGGAKKFWSYLNRRTFIALAQWIAFHVLYHIRKVYVEIKHRALLNPHSKKVIDMVRGRGEVRDHGASFYLRRISLHSDKRAGTDKK